MSKKIRVLVTKPGFDGHDLGARIIARSLRDAGMEVVYTGRQQTPEQIVASAIQEDVDVIGASFLSGAHLGLMRKIMERMKEKGIGQDILVLVGGTIPREDIAKLKQMGIHEVFPTGTPPEKAVEYIKAAVNR